MNSSLSFWPVQGAESKIKAHAVKDGNVYFATDTGKMFLDTNGKRISVGGAGAAIYYAESVPVEGNDYWEINRGDLVNPADSPNVDDIILNITDGAFYRIESISGSMFYCTRLAISGSGTGGAAVTVRPSLVLEELDSVNIINGSDIGIWFTATSMTGEDGLPLNSKLTITWRLYEGTSSESGSMYYSSSLQVNSGERTFLDFGSYLRHSATSTLSLIASGNNHDKNSATREVTVTSTNMSLKLASTFSNVDPFESNKVRFTVYATGKIDKTLDITFDGTLLDPNKYNNVGGKISASSTNETFDITIPEELCTHGAHAIQVDLYQLVNGVRGQHVDPIKFEVAVKANSDIPIVWLGNYNSTYYTYDSIQIPYLAYDPLSPNEATIYRYKNYVPYKDETLVVKDRSKFHIWEISDADNEATNRYQIACGSTTEAREGSQREIVFQVLQDKRDLTVAKADYLRLNFDPKGRSNNESKLRRQKWSYTNPQKETFNASFENFNWYNNGWMMDSNNRTFLRISNGAKFTLPLGKTEFAGNTQDTQSHTFEMMFKIRNVQNYSDLITNVTRYKINGAVDDAYYEEYEQSDFTNYDAFLQWKLGSAYDNIEFNYVQKLINLSNAVCKYCNGSGQSVLGWAFGSQDAFFKDGSKTLSVSYVEDELISLSIVFKYDSSAKTMIQFYLNGVITGVAYTDVTSFFVDSNIVFDSSTCDIDLYKFRAYETALDVQEVVKNYCVDRTDIDNFDMLSLAKENTTIKEYQVNFDEVIAWNTAHPDNQTMPYIIYDTSKTGNGDRLPWSKSVSIPVSVTFVNTQLDRAYALGELEELAKEDGLFDPDTATAAEKAAAVKLYYKYHCPSWTGDNVELVVQGTSSEYYPRRNYKIKTKTEYDSDGEERIHIFLNKGPFEEDYKTDAESTRQAYWYMNNYTNGTHKWTMKVDYMESSGSYNAGFASLVGNSYSKHPLQDYLNAEAFNTTITGEDASGNAISYNGLNPQISFVDDSTNVTSNANIRWQDYRTSLLGFPVMAFHKKSDGSYTFIGYYRMLLDKGSDEVLGFKPPKGVTANFLDNKNVRKKAECWEFSNNNRTYCSFRDPWDRVELSFMPPQSAISDETGLTAAGVPIVADSFEYRYNDNEDYLDILYGMGKKNESGSWECAQGEEKIEAFKKETGIDISDLTQWPAAREQMVDYYKNYEDVCKWVWSTCADNVVSLAGDGSGYTAIKVGNIPFTTDGSLYLPSGDSYVPITSGSYNETVDYFMKKEVANEGGNTTVTYVKVMVYGDDAHKYEIDKFYVYVDGVYSLSSDAFNENETYYTLTIDLDYMKTHANLLVAPATGYSADTIYYTYNPNVSNADVMAGKAFAVNLASVDGKLSEEEYNAGSFYVASPVTYSSGTHEYDTKEYRAEKFKKEVSSHFDMEYLATYFIMTEVFECYDSRGKNCMMASWGPLKRDGDYIWYPIFYDIDTQLGINNTGIPSFTFNIDATLNDNYSTSDSVLWNNLYSYFRSSYILEKYKHLKGENSTIFETRLTNPPLQSVDYIEDWYLFDENVTNNIATRGQRPLIITNLDAWYKYITITNIVGSSNPALLTDGTVGYMGRDGKFLLDSNGTYFYALQGDRQQSRRSFLTKRIDYVDSWLGVGDYARSGNNCIWGRVSANDATDTSDVWLEGTPADETYWVLDADGKETTTKTHPYDAQYWLDLTPIYSTYVTVSDDSAAYPSQKYDGTTSVNFKASAIESGVRRSPNYKEQLMYIYGSDKMLDIGDMSNLYWREFKIDGGASKLTRLKLGHDGVVNDYYYDASGNKVWNNAMTWKNGYLNQPSIPAGKGSSGMPLLKEANFCNITIQAGGSDPTLDLSTCEKLANFRATGSNLTQVTFADGVALDTLYLPASITNLSLVEANLLNKVLKTYTTPSTLATGNLSAEKGLYLEGFFDDRGSAALKNLNVEGGSLGYGSFDIFEKFYNLRKGTANNRLTMTDVEWCPYVQVVEGDSYDGNLRYFIDDEHYGLSEYTYVSDTAFKAAITRGELYYLDTTADAASKNSDGTYKIKANAYTIIDNLRTDTNFRSVENANNPSTLSGVIYIDNADGDAVDEATIADIMQPAYPNMKFFLTNVTQAYSAKFVVMNSDGSYSYVPDKSGDDSLESILKVSQNAFAAGTKTFGNPYDLYDPTNSKTHYDFIGWCPNETHASDYSDVLLPDEADKWGTTYKDIDWGMISQGDYSQTYYAAFEGHYYKAYFVDEYNENYSQVVEAQYNPELTSRFHTNVVEPEPVRETADEYRYALRGWTLTQNYGGYYDEGVNVDEYLVDITTIPVVSDITLYAVFQLESVYKKPTDLKYFVFTDISNNNYGTGWKISLNPDYAAMLVGKITLPATHTQNGVTKNVVCIGDFAAGLNITHIFFMPGSQYVSIENEAFREKLNVYNKLTMIKFPEDMTTFTHVGNYAFYFNRSLKSVNLPDTVTYIGDYAFCSTSSGADGVLEMNKLPNSLVTLGANAFYNDPYVNFTALPKSLTSIGSQAMRNCAKVAIIDFGSDTGTVDGSKLSSIGERAFYGSGSGLVGNYIILRNSVQAIGANAFEKYGGSNNNLTAYYTHASFDYDATDLGVTAVQPYSDLG